MESPGEEEHQHDHMSQDQQPEDGGYDPNLQQEDEGDLDEEE
jgi:hypothetical protein